MITIKNYDSRRALSDYKIGDIYMFHIHNTNLNNLVKIKENDFKTHIQSLTDVIESSKNFLENNTQYLNFTKSIGVVVDTHKATIPQDLDQITVLFKTESNDYVINKYVVNYTLTSI